MVLGNSSSYLNVSGGDVDSSAGTILICGETGGTNRKATNYTNSFFASYNWNYVPNYFYTIDAGFSNSVALKCAFGE